LIDLKYDYEKILEYFQEWKEYFENKFDKNEKGVGGGDHPTKILVELIQKRKCSNFKFDTSTTSTKFYFHDILVSECFEKNKKLSKLKVSEDVLKIFEKDIDYYFKNCDCITNRKIVNNKSIKI
jgi:hypothetical protein